jgi:hypothetical protein
VRLTNCWGKKRNKTDFSRKKIEKKIEKIEQKNEQK